MTVAGIVAEYNPFHNGHLHHLQETKRHADATVAVMSGNFVQRGECAILDRHTRAACAVRAGVDLVLGMPVHVSVGAADDFALGAVYLLEQTGIVDLLSFGCECGDLQELKKTAELREKAESMGLLAERMAEGKTFARAEAEALDALGHALSADKPNDVLALAYLRVLKRLDSSIKPLAIPRIGAFHGDEPVGTVLNATAIRQRLRRGEDVSAFVPGATAFSDLASMDYLERAVLDWYRRGDKVFLRDCYAMREGLENRICEAARQACGLQDLYERVKTKRYPMSAVRRAVLCGFLGVRDLGLPKYLHVLACNDTGRALLRQMKKTAGLPAVQVLSPDLARQFPDEVAQECRADDCFDLALPAVCPAGRSFRQNTKMIEE